MAELNPNHPMTVTSRELWHKIVAMIMYKQGVRKMVIAPNEVMSFGREFNGAITIRANDAEGVVLELVDDATAQRLAREEGGLPV